MEEVWRYIDGYEGYYEVSNLGRVRSVDRFVIKSNGVVQKRIGKIKKQTLNQDGYATVKLSKDGLDNRVAVHILVAKAFVDGWFDGAEVNHKDFDRTNNRMSNLEWVSHRDNVMYSIDAGHHVCTTNISGKHNPNYGNHTLSDKYRSNPELSKEKQGRQGSQNGRARSVVLTDDSGIVHTFGTIKECAYYIMSFRCVDAKVDWISIKISKAIKNGTQCYGFDVKNK